MSRKAIRFAVDTLRWRNVSLKIHFVEVTPSAVVTLRWIHFLMEIRLQHSIIPALTLPLNSATILHGKERRAGTNKMCTDGWLCRCEPDLIWLFSCMKPLHITFKFMLDPGPVAFCQLDVIFAEMSSLCPGKNGRYDWCTVAQPLCYRPQTYPHRCL